jgi:hypothetical protein
MESFQGIGIRFLAGNVSHERTMKRTPQNVFAILAFALLSCCAGNANSEKLTNLFFNYVKGTVEKVPREKAAAIPYPTMGLEFGYTPEVLLVLATATPEELDWYAGEALFVATQHGRVIRTVGLPNDLGGRRATSSLDVAARAISYALDFPDLGIFGAAALCSSVDRGEESVEILGGGIATRHIVEHCTVPTMKWTFDNDYWEDRATRYVWRSRQYIHPKSPPIVLEVFRPEDVTLGE